MTQANFEKLCKKAEDFCIVSSLAQALVCYKFNQRTNVQKGMLNNKDALVTLFTTYGPLNIREIQDAMMTWRWGRAEYYVVQHLKHSYFNDAGKIVPEYINRIKPRINILQNYFSGRFGGAGANFFTKSETKFGYLAYPKPGSTNAPEREIPIFWYKKCKSTFALTLEGMKRSAELKDQGMQIQLNK